MGHRVGKLLANSSGKKAFVFLLQLVIKFEIVSDKKE